MDLISMGNSRRYQSFSFASYPAGRLVLLFIAGIIIGNYWLQSLFWGIILFGLEVVIYLLAQKLFRHNYSVLWHRLSLLLYLFSMVTLGYLAIQISRKNNELDLPERILQLNTKDTVSFRGEVLKAVNSGYYHQYVVKVDSFGTTSFPHVSADFKLLVRAKWTLMRMLPKPGGQITFNGVMEKIPEVRNPYEFDYKKYLASQHIQLECQLVKLDDVVPLNSHFSWYWWRDQINNIIERNFSPDNVPVAKALLLGNKNALSTQTRNNFNRAGISHLLAVSGLHVGFIIMPIWFLIPWFWYHKKVRPLVIGFIAILLFLYAGITGFRLSVIRASIMAFFFLSGRLYQKRSNSINLLATAALCILIFNPTALFDVSFQLSFGAVAVILLLFPVVQQALPVKWRFGKLSFIITIVSISLIVQIGLFPLLAWYFHQFSIVAPISNIFAIPMAEFVVLWSWLCIGIGAFFPAIGHLVNWPSNILVEGLRLLSSHLTMFRWSWVNVHVATPFIFLVWLTALMFFASWHNPQIKWKWFVLFLSSLILIQMPSIYRKLRPPVLKVTVFDVGNADAMLLQTPHNKNIIIDTGVWHPNGNSGNKVLVPELTAMGIDHLDAVILTNPHSAYIGGIIPLLQNLKVDTIYNSGIAYKSRLYRNYQKLAHIKHIPLKSIQKGDFLHFDNSIAVFVLAPDEIHLNKQSSVVLKIVFGRTSFLLTGAADRYLESKLSKTFGKFLNSDFLKVAHQGRSDAASSSFFHQVSPKIAVISSDEPGRLPYPAQSVIERLIHSGAQLHYTGFEHALIFQSDGKRIIQEKWR